MGIHGYLSQGLLLLGGAVRLLAGGLSDARLVSTLTATLLALLINLLHPRKAAVAPGLLYLVLCFVWPELLSFSPLLLYLLLSTSTPWLSLALAAPVLYHLTEVDYALAVMLLAAVLLRYKDSAFARVQARYYTAVDDSSLRTDRQQRELRTLQQEQETSVKLAIAQERNRIARDIHDNVGHILSRGILQVGALALSTTDPAARESLEELKQSLNAGMDSVRHSVHNTRQDALYLDREIEALLQTFDFCPVRYHNSAATPLSLNNKYVVMAIIREALSNIMRHSNATQAAITLSEMDANHLLLISNNGTKAPAGSGGMGLAAMEERVRGLGGSLHITHGNGFRLLVTLPKPPTEGAQA